MRRLPLNYQPRRPITADELASLPQLYADGLSVREVAETHGQAYSTTHRRLRVAGVAFRPQCGASGGVGE